MLVGKTLSLSLYVFGSARRKFAQTALSSCYDCHSLKRNIKLTTLGVNQKPSRSSLFSTTKKDIDYELDGKQWEDILRFSDNRHNSAKIEIDEDEPIERTSFSKKLRATIEVCRQLKKSSIWVEVPITRSSIIEDLAKEDFKLHHANDHGTVANLYLWIAKSECKIPTFATHQIGVGAIVVNSKDEILVVRELRKNYLPWKIPGGLAELGEHLDEAAVREVKEETGINVRFKNVLSMRHTHGVQFNRSDLYFVCLMEPIESVDENGNVVIPEPVAEASEISAVRWLEMNEFRDLVNNHHPMMSHILKLYDDDSSHLQRSVLKSLVPGRKPSPIYHGLIPSKDE